jgi:hypothetical protein
MFKIYFIIFLALTLFDDYKSEEEFVEIDTNDPEVESAGLFVA